MTLKLRNLALVVASFLLGLHALDMESEVKLLSPHSLLIRQPQQLATCTYTALKSARPGKKEPSFPYRLHTYTFSIDLPGVAWETLCAEKMVVEKMLRRIGSRCRRKWTTKGISREMEELNATPEEGLCRITFKVTQYLRKSATHPHYQDDCILNPKPVPCELEPQDLPWPLSCSLTVNPGYTPEEDERLIALVRKGMKWKDIAKEFPGRNEGGLTHRYWKLRAELEAPPAEDG